MACRMSGLAVRDLSHDWGPKRALDGVSLRVEPGRFCALLGPNGAGKSTLFSILTRLVKPPRGAVTVAGHDMAAAPRSALAALGIVFQEPTLDLDLTVRRNLRYFAALHGLGRAEAERRIDAALDRLAMRERAGERARTLNGGHRRRAEIARALIHAPSVLLLDEPTVGLDPESRMSITAQVHELASETGVAVLWATHLTDEVRADDDLVILHRGRVLATGRAGEVAGGLPLGARFMEMTR